MMRKGQAAMEYLMTYGWALLVIVVVLGALVYMGVLNPQGMVPETCNLQAGLMCNVLGLSQDGKLTLEIANHQPVTMDNVQLCCALPNSQDKYCGNKGGSLSAGSSQQFTCELKDFQRNLGDTVNMDVYLNYDVSGVSKTIKGTVVAKVSQQ